MTLWVVAGWLAPWRHRVLQEQHERELAAALVHAWGVDTLAPFVLRADKSYFFGPDDAAFLAYRVVGGVAIVSGDPIGPPEAFDELLRLVRRPRARARLAGGDPRRVGALAAAVRAARAARALPRRRSGGRRRVVLARRPRDPQGAAVGAPPRARRLSRRACSSRASSTSDAARAARGVADAWRGAEPERGFVMALDRLFRLGDGDALFVVGFDPDGTRRGLPALRRLVGRRARCRSRRCRGCATARTASTSG